MRRCFHEHKLQCHKRNTRFRAFKSQLVNPSPKRSGSDYQLHAASQSMFKSVNGAYRRRKTWLGRNGERCPMAGFLKNEESYMVNMKINADLITGRR